jgi:hypothetical protein
MRFNTLLTIFSAIAIGDGVIAILAPGPFMNLIWHNRTGPEAYLFVQGWGSCLIALSVMAWAAKSLTDSRSRRLFALGFFIYHLIAAGVWLVDALSRGWTTFSTVTFVGLLLFTVGFGYFRFANPRLTLSGLNSPA